MKEKEIQRKKKPEEKNEEKKDNPVKRIKPLAEKLMIISTAIIISACTTSFNAKDSDAHDSADNRDSEATEVSGDVPPIDALMDVINDEETDVAGDTTVLCEPFNESSVELITYGETSIIGNIGIKYKGLDTETETIPIFDITCDDVVVRSDISAPISSDVVVNVSEHSFSVELTPSTANTFNSRVRVTVDTY